MGTPDNEMIKDLRRIVVMAETGAGNARLSAISKNTICRAADAVEALQRRVGELEAERDAARHHLDSERDEWLEKYRSASAKVWTLTTENERLRENLKSVCDNDLTLINLNSDLHTQIARLRGALELIAVRGGNLPDERLTSKTGPNDAVARGLMYVDCREIAEAALSPQLEGRDDE